ncbi:hypothetical protein EVAR_2559_1 [Eumeta japonica]|uniref:Uncharacterized protein n=1 Tax=Eumeta variegata TaxID=151549 RepID=A0A4C1SPU1_EUMVA|nr:hypothetical protein EVAR_2559_1 [Eumeta japonica]
MCQERSARSAETLGFGLRRLRLALCAGDGVTCWHEAIPSVSHFGHAQFRPTPCASDRTFPPVIKRLPPALFKSEPGLVMELRLKAGQKKKLRNGSGSKSKARPEP